MSVGPGHPSRLFRERDSLVLTGKEERYEEAPTKGGLLIEDPTGLQRDLMAWAREWMPQDRKERIRFLSGLVDLMIGFADGLTDEDLTLLRVTTQETIAEKLNGH